MSSGKLHSSFRTTNTEQIPPPKLLLPFPRSAQLSGLFAKATYLHWGYLHYVPVRLRLRYQLIAGANYLPEGYRRLRLWFAKPRFKFQPSPFLTCPAAEHSHILKNVRIWPTRSIGAHVSGASATRAVAIPGGRFGDRVTTL